MKTWMRALIPMLLALALAATASAQQYRVVAHSSVPVTSISRDDLSMLFLKKTSTYAKWGSNQKVVPFDLAADSATRASFSKAVHRKAVTAIKSYWQQQIFSGRGTPPAEYASDAEILAAISRTVGGIAYVSGGATIPSGVKQINVSD